jgi:cyclopropane fatty-acyl-phospholipid synthase-like methyltransferase
MENNPNLEIKSDLTYYDQFRTWPSLFDIRHDTKVLDIGCGRGNLGTYLQDKYGCKVTGLEIIEENHILASLVLYETHLGDIETMDLSVLGSGFDYIIFSDSLEHMLEPKAVLERVRGLMKEGGHLLIAMPNIRNFRVTVPLLFLDQWEYQDDGFLDHTHLRFFTNTSICNLIERCGYKVEQVLLNLPLSSKIGIINIMTLGLFRRHLTSHFFIKACLRKY